jgi:hypothetical protein
MMACAAMVFVKGIAMSDPVQDAQDGITAEAMAVIETAAAAYLGRKVRIVSVKLHSQGADDASSWAEQGRAALQSAHNIVQRGH